VHPRAKGDCLFPSPSLHSPTKEGTLKKRLYRPKRIFRRTFHRRPEKPKRYYPPRHRYTAVFKNLLFGIAIESFFYFMACKQVQKHDWETMYAMVTILFASGLFGLPIFLYPRIKRFVQADPVLSGFSTWILYASVSVTLFLLIPPIRHEWSSCLTFCVAIGAMMLLFYSAKRSPSIATE
jgi:hypothetical protein